MSVVAAAFPDFAALHPGYVRPCLLAVSCTFTATYDWSVFALCYSATENTEKRRE
jgi:hypothetical protein